MKVFAGGEGAGLLVFACQFIGVVRAWGADIEHFFFRTASNNLVYYSFKRKREERRAEEHLILLIVEMGRKRAV